MTDIPLSDEELLAHFPLEVAYPFGGEHYMLAWYDHWEGNHIILARTRKAVEQSYAGLERCKKKDLDLEPKGLFKINIVAPPPELRLFHAKSCFESEVRSFWKHISFQARELHKKTKMLPEGLVFCRNYVAKWEDSDDTEESDREHVYCKNCVDRITPVGASIVEVFMRLGWPPPEGPFSLYRSKWTTKVNAPAADPSKKLYGIGTNFGPHQEGLLIAQYDVLSGKDYLFYYQDPEEQDMSDFVGRYQNKVAAWEKKRKEDEAKSRAEWKDRDKEEKGKLISMFGPLRKVRK